MTGEAPRGALLPIEPVLPALVAALEGGAAVLQAPPGAGKTTRVPLALLEAGVPGRILMLEPRRVAARAAAERLAEALGERPGGRVGYRMRGEAVAGARIEVVTEGILTRMLQSAPDLPGIGCVIFDEFHERSLQADLGLALTLEARGALRPDLKVLVMSATLDAGPVATLIGDAPVVTAEGRAYPVEIIWLDRPWSAGAARLEDAVASVVLTALGESEGGVLVFLPGQGEIGRVAARLGGRLPAGVVLQTLHGGLPFAAQRAVLAPLAEGRRLVLSTAIAETSLTIPDVRVVVDAGRARRARYDPGSGMTRLVTERVSRAEAVQRQGRAGRVAPGRCYRLWTKGEEGALPLHPPPEIASADLAPLALELAVWGADAPDGLAFLTPPPAPAFAEARALLTSLDAIGPDGRITGHGKALAALPVHPRLGHMLLVATAHGSGALAADLAALVEGRDPLRGEGRRPPVDLALRLAALRGTRAADPAAVAAIRTEAKRLRALAPKGTGTGGLSPGAVLSLAFPDRIGQRRPGSASRYLLGNGKGAVLPAEDELGTAPFIVAADLDGDLREATVRLALPVTEGDLRELHAAELRHETVCEWSRREKAVIARERLRLGALTLEDRQWREAPPEAVALALGAGLRELGLGALPWTPALRRLAGRVEWLRRHGAPDLPDFSDDGLLAELDDWLVPWLAGFARAADLGRVDLAGALDARLGHDGRQRLDRLAPASVRAPTGTTLPVDYSDDAPRVSVRLQELFGMTEHPTVGPERIPLVIELLSPAQRPVQTTADLPGFWRTSYADVRRDLRGRYPRHPWPEDPAAAEATRRVKPRGT
ncbi:ATP-dependent helicase HrpB [Amaricoccus macauensis]|uniref:ATP-dependent helicase HrpB n=1 Tax=Amaricoccus macauensis TaxID=57001 RepID=A0A840SMA4_9RHOB|nr:ATP-dependent helicase HrpB [Amaricoccus macauensis]MBB5223117.1 ATP-dependent helicase HrpB [Amaricoccus macauensis]